MADLELVRRNPQLLDAVARVAGVDRVMVMDETLGGESRSTFAVAAGDDELVVKLVPGAQRALDNQRRLVRLVGDLRRRGYPVPEYVGVGESGGTIFTVQWRLPGKPLHRDPGLPPAPELFASVLPSLLTAIDLQRDAGDLAYPPWPAWLLETIETGGDGYCLHATMRQAPRTAALLRRLQTLARRNQQDEARTRDIVHFDMNPANILQAEGASAASSTGTSRSTVPGKATAALTSRPCSFTPTTSSRPGKRCGNAHSSSAAWRGPRSIYATSACDRWSGRGGTAPAAPTTHVSWSSPTPCWRTARREVRDQTGPGA